MTTTVKAGRVVTLTSAELITAATVGVLRQVQNIRLGRRDRYGARPVIGWQLHIEGACGEAAVAKALNRYWMGQLGDLRADDVDRMQVRTTSCPNGRLILHPDDPDDRAFVLVIGSAPTYEIAGWIEGRHGKRREWWDETTGRPAYFVPAAALHSLDTLPA